MLIHIALIRPVTEVFDLIVLRGQNQPQPESGQEEPASLCFLQVLFRLFSKLYIGPQTDLTFFIDAPTRQYL